MRTEFEIVLAILISLLVLFIVIVITKNSKISVIGGINKSENETQRVIKMSIRNMSVDDISNQYTNKYRFDVNLSFDNDWEDKTVVPVLRVGKSYALCDRKTLNVPKGISVKECEFTLSTGEKLVIDCGMPIGNYFSCTTLLEKGQVVDVGGYSVRFGGLFFKFMSNDYLAKFFIYDGNIPYKYFEFFDSTSGSEHKTNVNGGWASVTVLKPKKYESSCVEIKTFGESKSGLIKNEAGIYIYPAGCQFWNGITPNAPSDKIADTIEYCSDTPLGYSEGSFLVDKKYVGC